MNKNKGFIGIGLILAIILGIVVVGGGAYYLGKSSFKQGVKNLPVVDNSQQVNVVNPTTPTVATGCTSSSTPSIKVLSPNGGEVYKVGDKITVKWSSCNIPATHKFYIGLMPNVESQGSPAMIILSNSTINDGTETFSLDVSDWDINYSIFMKDNDLPNGSTNAWSNKFTINSGTKDVSTNNCSTWLTYEGIYSIKYPNCWEVESIKGGSIGSTGYETGIILKLLNSKTNDDYISIAGWQADCSNINVSGGENPSTKAFCFKPENGKVWEGEYITSMNQGKLFGIPVSTRSKNPDVLKMFDLIVEKNKE